MPKYRDYFSGWVALRAPDHRQAVQIGARGWRLAIAQCRDLDRIRGTRPNMPQRFRTWNVIVQATSRVHAQRAVEILHAAWAVVHGSVPWANADGVHALELPMAVPRDFRNLEGVELERALLGVRNYTSSGEFDSAIRLATRATRERRWQYALFKLYESLKIASIEFADTRPDNFETRTHVPSRWPSDHVRLTAAITLAYSAIEELGLLVQPREVTRGDKRARFNDGTWVPEVLENLEARLKKARIEKDTVFVWAARGVRRRHERQKSVPLVGRPQWNRRWIRDSYVLVVDALDHARWLRNQVSGHRIDDRARSLTIFDVSNVQNLARLLLMSATQSWWPEYQSFTLAQLEIKNGQTK